MENIDRIIFLEGILQEYLIANGSKKIIQKIKNSDDIVRMIKDHPLKEDFNKKNIFITYSDVLSNIYDDILVMFFLDDDLNVGKGLIEKVSQLITEYDTKKCLLITYAQLTGAAINELEKLPMITHYIETEFLNPSSHAYSPKIKIYKNQDAKRFVEKYGSKTFQKIHKGDPLCKFNGCEVGDIIEYDKDVGYNYLISTQKYFRIVI
jgi:DNA-directed RNA polymerase subunit H (RpoH/RPB5)